jgi:adenine-specific DNA-methyltransferase
VWNRRKADLHPRTGKTRAAIVWGADLRGGQLRRDPSRDETRYLALQGTADEKTMLTTEPVILAQRTTAPEQARRLVCAELTPELLTKWGGRVVVENHVNIIKPNSKTKTQPKVSQQLLTRLLATDELDRLLRCISGSVAVSSFELEALRFPDTDTLAAWEHLSESDLRQAVAKTYGNSDQP